MTTDASKKVWENVGVKPVINGNGHVTVLGGARLSPRVWQAMEDANPYFVDMRDLLRSTGEIIAPMVGAEAAFVTSGGAAALNLATAACISGDDLEKIERLPHSEGMKNEVVILNRMKQMGYRYWRCFETAGGRLQWVGSEENGTVDDMERAITENTAALHYLGRGPQRGGVPPLEDVIALGKKHNIPVIVDAAGETWPVDGLSKFAKAGADLVAYAAKYFNAPHSTGILCGKKELIDIAFKHTFVGFQYGTMGIGRGYKIERHEIVAVVEGLKEWLSMNHEERLIAEDNMVATITAAVKDIKGVEVSPGTRSMVGTGDPLSKTGGPAGSMTITIDSQVVGKTAGEVAEELAGGNPSIVAGVRRAELAAGTESMGSMDALGLTMICMEEDQAPIVAERLRAALSK
jgi:uncharacterized pyridoxal phosphate-dependent enzyme